MGVKEIIGIAVGTLAGFLIGYYGRCVGAQLEHLPPIPSGGTSGDPSLATQRFSLDFCQYNM